MFNRKNKPQEITVSVETVIRVVVIVALTLVLFQIIENLLHPLTLVFISFFLAIALNPVVTKLSSLLKLKSRTTATAIAYFSVIALLTLFFSLIIPPLVRQTTDFVVNLPETVTELQQNDDAVGRYLRENDIDQDITEFVEEWTQDVSRLSNSAVSVANRVISNIISILLVLILTFFMLSEGPRWVKLFWKYYPEDKRKHHKELADKMYDVIIGYVNGQVIVAGIGATFSVIALLIMTRIFGVDDINVLALGGIVFLFSLVPSVGTFLGAAIVVLFSALASFPLAVAMAIYFIVYQQIENASVQPIIQSRGNTLTPMLVFIAAIFGISFGGIVGAFVAIPAAGCAKILIEDWLSERSKRRAQITE